MITITSLTHPTMIAKIRLGLKTAALGKGHELGGHANRVYIQNSKGQNIMRIDWKGNGKFVAYGGADWGRTEVTDIVKAALKRANVKPVHTYTKHSSIARLIGFLAVALMLMGSHDSAFAEENKANRTVQDNEMYARVYAQCMNSKDDPGVFFEESCRDTARLSSKVEVVWSEVQKTWVRAVQL